MLLITDGETPIVGADDLDSIKKTMKDNGTILYVILVGNNDSIGISENAEIFSKMAKDLDGKFLRTTELGTALKFLSSGVGMGTKPRSVGITLEISPGNSFPCKVWTKCVKKSVPTLKRLSTESFDPLDSTGGLVKTDRSYRDTETDEEIESQNRLNGYRYGPQFIPVSDADKGMFKLSGETVIKIIGFKDKKHVLRHHFLESAEILEGPDKGPNNLQSATVISALAVALRKSDKVGIARLVKNKDGDPKLVALIAPSEVDATLRIHRLPCQEDCRDFLFPNLPAGIQISREQREAASALVDAMTVPFEGNSSDSDRILTIFPALQSVMHEVKNRALEIPESERMCIPSPFKSVADDPSAIKVQEALAGLKQYFILEADEKVSKKKKRNTYWNEVVVKDTTADVSSSSIWGGPSDNSNSSDITLTSDLIECKEGKEGEVDMTIPSLTLGTTAPDEVFQDIFKSVMAQAEGLSEDSAQFVNAIYKLTKEMGMLGQIIEQMIVKGGSAAYYRKAISCVKVFRQAALTTKLHYLYNNFLRGVKTSVSKGRHSKFWADFVNEGQSVRLISREEDDSCLISADDAVKFMLDESELTAEATEHQSAVEEDDLFGNLE